VRLLAAGSPHGDDRIGWEVVERLREERLPGVEPVVLAEPLRLLEHLDGCGCLVVVDACRSGAEPGTVVRLAWSEARPATHRAESTHGFGVAEVLALAEALGRLPPRVVLLGVEAQVCGPGAGLSPAVRAALPELRRQVLEEICRPAAGE
jgi:hydrogenase maturation protease